MIANILQSTVQGLCNRHVGPSDNRLFSNNTETSVTYTYEDACLYIFPFLTCPHVQIIGDVRGRGMFFGIDLVKDRETREPHTAAAAHILGVLKQVT